MKLFRKKLLGRRVCLSLVTRSLKRTHLASLSRSCSQFEMLQMFIHLMQFTWWFGPAYLSARVTFFESLTLVEMSGMLILIKGNDILALNNVTRILPVRLKVKLKTISGHRMPNDWQFTSMITITVTYPRKGLRCAVETRLLLFFTVYCLFDRCCCC